MEVDVPQTIDGVGTIGIGGTLLMLLWQIAKLATRVQLFLEQLEKHHEAVESKLGDLVLAIRLAGGVPEPVLRDLTPVPRDPPRDPTSSPGRRRGIDPR
jgi:hypothetical protein